MTGLDLAALAAMTLSFAALGLFAYTEAWPRLSALPVERALVPLLWIHSGRHIALQLFSSQDHGFGVSDSVRDQIVYGDLLGMVLALVCLGALHWGWRLTRVLLWMFVVVTIVDLANAMRGGIAEGLLGKATDISWMILNFYVPVLWMSLGLIVALLLRWNRAAAR